MISDKSDEQCPYLLMSATEHLSYQIVFCIAFTFPSIYVAFDLPSILPSLRPTVALLALKFKKKNLQQWLQGTGAVVFLGATHV